MMCMKSEKIDAAYVTTDKSVGNKNMKPPMAPLDSALKTGLVTILWRCVIVISTCYATILLGGAMSAGFRFFRKVKIVGTKKICRTGMYGIPT